ncbi:Hsp20 family protein [candidate division KSB1 bacterium]|nr:Hsp20 family protein [candidate division KSB1 bacterium]
MLMRGVSPWDEVERLQRDMNRLFSGFNREPRGRFPAVNVWTKPEGALVTAEIPGYDSKDIELSVQNKTLVISGSRKPLEEKEGQTLHRRERNHGEFNRTVNLTFPVEVDATKATFKDGVLYIELPRAEADKPKKIEIAN